MSDLKHSLRFSARNFRSTLLVVTILVVGITSTSVVASILRSVVFAPLPYRDAEQLIAIKPTAGDRAAIDDSIPINLAGEIIERCRSLDSVASLSWAQSVVRMMNGERRTVQRATVSGEFFRTLGAATMAAGRAISQNDALAGAPPVLVISDHAATQLFGERAQALGSAIVVDGVATTVVGITSPGFRFPGPVDPDVITADRRSVNSAVTRYANVIARLKPGIELSAVEADLHNVQAAERQGGSSPSIALHAVPLQDSLLARTRGPLWGFVAAAALLLISTCASAATLVLLRCIERQRQLAIRLALGASPSRVASALIVESVVLGLVATTVSLVAAMLLERKVVSILTIVLPRATDMRFDVSMVLTAAAIGIGISVLSSLVVVWKVLGRRFVAQGSGISGHFSPFGSTSALRKLVFSQVTVATALLAIAVLLIGSLWRITSVDLGFAPTDVLTFRIPSIGLGRAPQHNAEILLQLVESLRHEPGVKAVGLSTSLPLEGHAFRFSVAVQGRSDGQVNAEDQPGVDVVSPGFLESMGIRVSQGRSFGDRDTLGAEKVAIVNEAFARAYLSGLEVLDCRLSLGGRQADADISIVGVVADVMDGNPGSPVRPTVYLPPLQAVSQMAWHTASIAVKIRRPPPDFLNHVRASLTTLSPGAVLYDVASFDQRLARIHASRRVWATLVWSLALPGLLLAALGVYGVITYSIETRRHEFGVRLALGATPGRIRLLVFTQELSRVLLAIFVGTAIAFEAGGAFRTLLFGITSSELYPYLLSAAIVTMAAMIAIIAPSRRAARTNVRLLLNR